MILRRMMRHVLPEGMSLRLRREWLARRIAAGTAHFEDDVPLLKRYVKPTDVCWDIGANTGTYTLHLSRLARQVFAFEPVPHNLDILRDVRKRAGLENVIISSLALSDRAERRAATPRPPASNLAARNLRRPRDRLHAFLGLLGVHAQHRRPTRRGAFARTRAELLVPPHDLTA